MLKKAIGFLIVGLMLFSTFYICFGMDEQGNSARTLNGSPGPRTFSYTLHAPIRIDSDAQFNASFPGRIISGFEINGIGQGCCIYIGNCSVSFRVEHCHLTNASGFDSYNYYMNTGLYLYNTNAGRIDNNNCSTNSNIGIFLDSSSKNNVTNDTCYGNTYGIYLYSSHINIIRNDTCFANLGMGIQLSSSNLNTVKASNSSGNSNYGIYMTTSANNMFVNSTFNGNSNFGVYVSSSTTNTFTGNNMSGNSQYGIYLDSSNSNTFKNNTCTHDGDGIYLGYSNINTFMGNNCSGNYAGIYLASSETNSLKLNKMYGCGICFQGDGVLNYNTQNIDTTNLVNGRSVYYVNNQTGSTVALGAGQVIIAASSLITVHYENLTSCSIGILVAYSDNCSLRYNNCTNNYYEGIDLLDSFTNDVWCNNCSLSNDYGIVLTNSNINTISYNNCLGDSSDGVYLYYSEYNYFKINNLSGGSDGAYLYYSNTNSFLFNNCSNNGYSGIDVESSNNNILEGNNNYIDYQYGIYLSYSQDNTVRKNHCNANNGICAYFSDLNTITSNYCNGSVTVGIAVDYSQTCTLQQNIMSGSGVYVQGSNILQYNTHDIDITNLVSGRPIRYLKNQTGGTVLPSAGQVILGNCNKVTVQNESLNCTNAGITLGFSTNCTIANNTCNNGPLWGIDIEYSNRTKFINNNCSYDSQYGIYEMYSDNITIVRSGCVGSTTGIYISSSNHNRIKDNFISGNTEYNLYLTGCNCNNITNNTCSYTNYQGIYLGTCLYNNLTHNTCNNDEQGIYLSYSSYNNVTSNICHINNDGIYVEASPTNKITYNDCDGNYLLGIYLYASSTDTLTHNMLNGCGVYILSNNILDYNTHYIDATNNVNGHSVIYMKNLTGLTAPASAGEVIIVNCTFMTVQNEVLNNGCVGVLEAFSNNCTVRNNNCSLDNDCGIYSGGSQTTTFRNNTCTADTQGILLVGSNSNTIVKNNLSSDGNMGIYLSSSNFNIIRGNNCSLNNINGIYFSSSSDNILTNNNFTNNANFGVSIDYNSLYNRVHHNIFIGNDAGGIQAYDGYGGNFWNTSTQGNYWSGWTTPDYDHNGIVDNPYNISVSVGAIDYFPLTGRPAIVPETQPFAIFLVLLVLVPIVIVVRRRR